ncbi:hypothetical protein Q3G72_027330 [Acer saccharum]|nr:hypothetical protein Q3G72_027330 [Acer saccharum]
MTFHLQKCLKNTRIILKPSVSCTLFHSSSETWSHAPSCSPLESSHSVGASLDRQQVQCVDPIRQSDVDLLIKRVRVGSSVDEVFQVLTKDDVSNSVLLSHTLVDKLLHRFKDDWKSALGVFRWAGSCPGYEHTPELYSMMVDILGKAKQMDRMWELMEEMNKYHFVTPDTVAKAMRRFAGAEQWEDAVRTFDKLETFGLEKNTETMNLLLDTLCKEYKVEHAREIYLQLKSHIVPNAHTFNIFINGWCKVNRVEEAHWTLQEMKGHGCRPCVISYSTIIQFYCRQYSYSKIYELLDEMQAQGCPPNVVTYTTVMCYLTKAQEFEEAIQIAERMKTAGCKPDTHFYNALIHTLRQAGRVEEAVHVFEVEMPRNGLTPNTSTYNTMIAMFCYHRQEEKAFDILGKMENTKHCKPDAQTFYPLLKSCFRTGNIDSCLSQLLDDMVNMHHLSFDLSTYTLLIHGFCRSNKCVRAYQMFEEMISQEMTPKYTTCRLLLAEVKLHNMNEAAEKIEDVMKKL